ncbi:hypothetical protein [Sorangium sp. So ce1335]|uniref:hypothetical protein n=1 Tax=Sorangium sp. So ce1335 TaxID=3133335 RepID=UPI003F6348E0
MPQASARALARFRSVSLGFARFRSVSLGFAPAAMNWLSMARMNPLFRPLDRPMTRPSRARIPSEIQADRFSEARAAEFGRVLKKNPIGTACSDSPRAVVQIFFGHRDQRGRQWESWWFQPRLR